MGILGNIKNRISNAIFNDKDKVLPKKVRDFLTKAGNEVITSLVLCREPIASPIKSILNLATSGQVNKTIAANGWDSFFHLWMNINNKYAVEKNEIITTGKARSGKDELPVIIPDGSTLTIQNMFDNARNGMGPSFFTYDMVNNCQQFILGLLKYSKLGSNEARAFIYQDASDVITALGSKGEAGANFITKTAGKAHQFIQELFMKRGGIVVRKGFRMVKNQGRMRFK